MPGVGKVRPAGQIRPASVTLWPARVVTCGVDHGLAFHTHTHNQWPWISEKGTAIGLQPLQQQQHDSWYSTKWQVGHLTPSFTSPSSRTQTYRLAYTHPFIVNQHEQAWLPSSCAPLKEDCCHVWIDLQLWAAVRTDERKSPNLATWHSCRMSISIKFFFSPLLQLCHTSLFVCWEEPV